jgi:site-specific DNA-methyltransferase (adenine-specific)
MIELLNGDCLELMKDISEGSVDMVCTDPPYMINTKSTGAGKLNPWGDYCNAAYWYAEWMRQARRLLKPTGCLWSFLNWRSFVTFQKAACDIGWPIESVLVWDKCWIGPGGSKGLRPSYELVALWAMPEFKLENRGLYDIQRFKWSSKKPHGHPAEKPETLLEWIVSESTKRGDKVLDIFMGSGTTGVACTRTGRDFTGIEMNEEYFNVAKKRIEAEVAQLQVTT